MAMSVAGSTAATFEAPAAFCVPRIAGGLLDRGAGVLRRDAESRLWQMEAQ